MIIQCKHITSYKYENEVFLNPHIFYLLPQYRQYYNLVSYSINIFPLPSGQTQLVDLENNLYLQCWFSELSDSLEIIVDFQVKTTLFNSLNFIYDSNFTKGTDNFEYGKMKSPLLESYLHFNEDQDIKNYVLPLYKASNDVLSFVSELNILIFQDWQHEIRNEQGTNAPSYTYHYRKGSCRDLAVMVIDMLRHVGLASRFVSGYAWNETLTEEHYLHAWVEIFIPGAGWIGLDPSLGLFTDHRYIPLAASFLNTNTSPVYGTFGGSSNSSMYAFVELSCLE